MRRQKQSDEKNTVNEFNKLIVESDKSKNKDLIKKHFWLQSLIDIQKQLYEIKNAEENKKLVQLIESRLNDLEEKSKNVLKWKRNEQSDEMVEVVEKILEFNNQNWEGQGLKISTQDQILIRLPISLAQLQQEITQKNLNMK